MAKWCENCGKREDEHILIYEKKICPTAVFKNGSKNTYVSPK